MSSIRYIQNKVVRLALGITTLLILSPASALALPVPVSHVIPTTTVATSLADTCTSSFLGLEPWYKFLPDADFQGGGGSNQCDLKCFNILPRESSDPNSCGQTKSEVPLLLIAVIDDLLRVAGLVAVGFVVYGAFQYTSSQGNPDATSRAQGTIVNALIGMALAMTSVLIVSYIGHALGK